MMELTEENVIKVLEELINILKEFKENVSSATILTIIQFFTLGGYLNNSFYLSGGVANKGRLVITNYI